MANPFVKGWKYLMALFGAKIDEYADPKVQIQQAVEDAQRQHQALVQQAAAVIGNQRQLEMRLSRQLTDVEKLQSSTRQALVLADKARATGDAGEAAKYESTAQTFATQLIAGEQSIEDLKTLHDQALSAASQARKAVENNAHLLQQKLAERTKLLSQLEQAKMQETVARSLESMSSLAAPSNTPSLDEVREKIERRYANAMGRAELASTSVEGRMLEVQKTTLDMAGASRLEQIRASMAAEQLEAGAAKPAVEAGRGEAAAPAEQKADDPAEQKAVDPSAQRAVDPSAHRGVDPSAQRALDDETTDGTEATVSRIDEIRASLKKEQSGESAAS